MHPKISQNSTKTQFWTHRFLGSLLAPIFDQKWLQKATPKSCPRRPLSCPRRPFDNFFGFIFRIRLFGAPRPNFGVIWASFSKPQSSILESFWLILWFSNASIWEPCTSDTYSFRFCSFDKHILCLILSLPADFRRSPSKQGRRWIAVRRLR